MNRPTGVTIIAICSFLGAVASVAFGFGFLLGGTLITALGMSVPASIVGFGAFIGAGVCFASAVLAFFNGMGLLKLRNWARIVTIVFIALGLLSAASGVLIGLLHFQIFITLREAIVAAIDLWILLYLFKPHVKQAFGTAGS